MKTQTIAYSADGADMIGYLATPTDGGQGPAVLIAHEAPGHTEHVQVRARRLAAAGYTAFALDYHGGGQALPMDRAMAALNVWWADPTGIRKRAAAALEVLTAQPGVDARRVAAIGYCYGGTTALELARTGAEIAAVVGFHAGLTSARPQDSANIKGKVLVCIGASDPIVPPEQQQAFVKEMTEAGIDWRMNLYGGVEHSFTNPAAVDYNMPGIVFHGPTDRRSWRAMIDLFSETIGIP